MHWVFNKWVELYTISFLLMSRPDLRSASLEMEGMWSSSRFYNKCLM